MEKLYVIKGGAWNDYSIYSEEELMVGIEDDEIDPEDNIYEVTLSKRVKVQTAKPQVVPFQEEKRAVTKKRKYSKKTN